jgi:hypothetical protein
MKLDGHTPQMPEKWADRGGRHLDPGVWRRFFGEVYHSSHSPKVSLAGGQAAPGSMEA